MIFRILKDKYQSSNYSILFRKEKTMQKMCLQTENNSHRSSNTIVNILGKQTKVALFTVAEKVIQHYSQEVQENRFHIGA